MDVGEEEAASSSPSSCLPRFSRSSCFLSLTRHCLRSPGFRVFRLLHEYFPGCSLTPSLAHQPSQQPEGHPHGSHGLLGPSSTYSTHPSLPSRLPREGRCGATEPFSGDTPSVRTVAVLLVAQGSAGGAVPGIGRGRSWDNYRHANLVVAW